MPRQSMAPTRGRALQSAPSFAGAAKRGRHVLPSTKRSSVVSSTVASSATRISMQANDDVSEKQARRDSRRTAIEEMNRSLVATSDSMSEFDSESATPRVPILSNFEEWMKLATDNKINAANSWNFALIDYFHDMSLLKEGDSINFLKASCTLDGCVKIYTSRIDSIATETGKLLSGLAENSSKKSKTSVNQIDDDEGGDDDNEDEADGADSARQKKSKRRVHLDATLAKDFSAVQQKKLDLEFSVDPLFKKATADFDEGGAKGLLLNHLGIDSSGRVVFDTSQESAVTAPEDEEDSASGPIRELDLNALRDRYFADILDTFDDKFLSPSLRNFEFPADPDAVPEDMPFLQNFANAEDLNESFFCAERDNDVDFGGDYYPQDDDFDQAATGGDAFGVGGEEWLSGIRTSGTAFQSYNDGYISGGRDHNEDDADDDDEETTKANSYVLQFVNHQGKQTGEDADIFAYFDANIKKNWTGGSQNWRIEKLKQQSYAKKAAQPRPAAKKKQELVVNFLDDDGKVDEEVLFEHGSNLQLPKSQWRSTTRNLLPDDINYSSEKLLRLFLKPKVRLHLLATAHKSGKAVRVERFQSGTRPVDLEDEYADDITDEPYIDFPMEERPATYDANFFQDGNTAPSGAYDDDDDHSDNAFFDSVESLGHAVSNDGDVSMTINAAADPPVADVMIGNLTAMMEKEEAQDEFEFGSQLVVNSSSRRFKPEYVNYARVAKKVDVKKLKDNLWTTLHYEQTGAKVPTPAPPAAAPSEEVQKFSQVVSGLRQMYSAKAMSDISTSFCFICLLHLANEKGLEIESSANLKDLAIRRDPTAVIEEYE
ncbi:condensin complex subunit 2/barren [Limtongia smithiae]|uniref:condensin complex subunit 2/barren n=1 Tax=Limtongia smithiae TaxID=1125753 RepID=UPI0034CF8420